VVFIASNEFFFPPGQTANLETEGEQRQEQSSESLPVEEKLQNEGILGQARLCELVPAEVPLCWSL
jgi:hypothetical protein